MDNPAFRHEEGVIPYKDKVIEEQKLPEARKGLRGGYLRQLICALTISTGLYVISFLISSTSMLPLLLNDDSVNATYTSEDLKWLASGPILISVPGNFLAVFLTEKFGPTRILRASLLLSFFFYLLKALLPTLTVMWITRIALWIIVGMFDIICVPLVALLSEPSMRGLCGAIPELTTSFGMLFVFVTFSYLHPSYAVLLDAIPVLLGFIGTLFVPESPYWLLQRGRQKEAARSIAMVIGPSRKEKQTELLDEILSRYEINTKDNSEEAYKPIPIKNQIKLLKKRENWKPVLLSIVLFAFREFGGNNILFFYALTIFKASDIAIDAFLCTIIVGVVRVVSTFLSANFQDKFGRRIILIGTTFVSAVCLLTSGLVLFYNLHMLKLVPLIGIIIFILMVGIGMGPVPFIIVGEVIPSDIKFLGVAVVYSLFNIYQFAIVNVLPKILQLFSVGTIFIAFSVSNFIISFVLYFILPETKCKTFTEIENMFKKKPKL